MCIRDSIKASPLRIKEWDFYQVSDREKCLQFTFGHASYACLLYTSTKARFSHSIRLSRRRSITKEKLREAMCVTRDGTRITLCLLYTSIYRLRACGRQRQAHGLCRGQGCGTPVRAQHGAGRRVYRVAKLFGAQRRALHLAGLCLSLIHI